MKAKWVITILFILAVALGLFMFLCGESNESAVDSEKRISGKLGPKIFALLPQKNEEIAYFNIVPNGSEYISNSHLLLGKSLIRVSEQLAANNSLTSAESSIGYFILSNEGHVEGLFFADFAIVDNDMQTEPGFVEPPVYMSHKWLPQKSIYFPEGIPHSSNTKISNLDALAELNDLTFLNFGEVGFKDGIWDSLANIASSQRLLGVSVLHTGELLAHRHDHAVPNVKGLAAYVESISEIEQLTLAFPDLNFLSLTLSRELFLELVSSKTLSQGGFEKIQVIRLLNYDFLDKPWDYFEVNSFIDYENSQFDTALFSRSKWLSEAANLLYTDSRLYSLPELYHFGEQADRYNELNVVISGYGYYDKSDRVRPFIEDIDQNLMVESWRD